jgi:hypothetical protein
MKITMVLASSAILAAGCGSPVDASHDHQFSQRTDASQQSDNGIDGPLTDSTHANACQQAWSRMPRAQKADQPDRAAFLAECLRTGRWVMSCTDGWIAFGPEPARCIGHGGSRDTFWQPDG